MSDKPQMTKQKARVILWSLVGGTLLISIVIFALGIYGLAHPMRHRVLLLLLGVTAGPAVLAVMLTKTGFRGFFDSDPIASPSSVGSIFRRSPSLIFFLPVLLTTIVWGYCLVAIGMKQGGDSKEWANRHRVITVLWIMAPQVVTAYLLVMLHATYLGLYIAGSIVYMTVANSLKGLGVENGVVRFFNTYRAQASPIVILCYALVCCSAFGVLHFAIWSAWPNQYAGIHGIQDAIYFSAVTMATVGYGDIMPVGQFARWVTVAEIISGVVLIVVGLSASMTVWFLTNQPEVSQPDSDPPRAAADATK